MQGSTTAQDQKALADLHKVYYCQLITSWCMVLHV